MKGFKDFIAKGNVLDLAIGAVIAIALTAVVSAVTTNIVQPVINSFGSPSVDNLGFDIISGQSNTHVNIAAIINAIIIFFITTAVVYFIFVMPLVKLKDRATAKKVSDVAETIDLEQKQLDTLKAILAALKK